MSGVLAYVLVVLDSLPGLVIGLVVHELAHAALALRCGDPSPQRDGRMTLDPRRHLDAFGLAALLVAGFGWSRPVHLDPVHVRRPGQRAAIVAAGPVAQLLVAAAFAAALRVEQPFSGIDLSGFDPLLTHSTAEAVLMGVLLQGFFINVALVVFNLLPLPGLDGYALVRSLVFPRAAACFHWLERNRALLYAALLLLVLVPPQVTRGAVNPLAAATSGFAGILVQHLVAPGATPIFPGLPNIFRALG